ncbi:MAG: hypothetical protein ACREJT_00960, partial [Myxococcota bacterium]
MAEPDILSAGQLVNQAVERAQAFTQQLTGKVNDALDELTNYDIEEITTSVVFTPPPSSSTPFVVPDAPEAPAVEIAIGQAPADPAVSLPSPPNFQEAPTFNTPAPVFNEPPVPAPVSVR